MLIQSSLIFLAITSALAEAKHHGRHHHKKPKGVSKRSMNKRDYCAAQGVNVAAALPASASAPASSSGSTSTSSSASAGPTDTTASNPTTDGNFVASTPSSGSWWSATSSDYSKPVVAHVVVGNTYSYGPSDWANDIGAASAQGIDGFVLNIGLDSWQNGHVSDAYNAAAAANFKMMISFDLTVISCGDDSTITTYLQQFSSHPAQLKDASGAALVTTFDGGNCKSDSQWQSDLAAAGVAVRFAPTFFNDLTSVTLKSLYPSIGGDVLWGAAWPPTNAPTSWTNDAYRISRDGLNRAAGDLYITTVSPWFFTHYSYKNYIWYADEHLYASRWESLFENRDSVDIVEIATWNDFGESTYIGPIPASDDLPASGAWTDGFDHDGWLEMTGYYATAFKTGAYPAITADKIFISGRPHGVNDNAPDGLGRPSNYDWLADQLWIILFSTDDGSLTVTQGSSSQTFSVTAGVNKLNMDLAEANGVTAVLSRGGSTVFSFNAAISFTHSPSSYNFNANVAHGP